MDPIRVSLIHSQGQYQGQFSAPAFKMLNNVVVLYENILGSLKNHGASVATLKYDVGVGDFSQANVNCTILNFNAVVKLRLEALEITFHNLVNVGEEVAYQVINDAWKAAKDSYAPLTLTEQTITTTTHLKLLNMKYDDVLRRFITPPEKLPGIDKAGVVFYLGEEFAPEVKKGSILLDQSLLEPGGLIMQATLTFDASKVSPENLRATFNGFFKTLSEKVGLVYS